MAVGKTVEISRSRLVHGANAVLQVVLAVSVVVLAVFLAQQFKGQVDLTRTGINSLSPRTKNLLKNLDQKVTITALYTVLSEYDKLAVKYRDTVRDELDLYQSAGGAKVATYVIDPMKDQQRITTLLERLSNMPEFKGEAAPQAEALRQFPELNTRISELATAEAASFREFVAGDPGLRRVREIQILATNLDVVAREAKKTADDVSELTRGKIPRYGRAVETARTYLTDVRAYLQDAFKWMTADAKKMTNLPPAMLTFFAEAPARYEPVLGQIDQFLARNADQKDGKLKLENIYEELSRWPTQPPILVETETDARVLSFNDVWPYRRDQNGPRPADGDPREFAGEQAISSAVLQLTQKERTAVVFTRFGGRSPLKIDPAQLNPMMSMDQLPRPPFGMLNEALQKANFLTEDWDVATQKTPPAVKDAKRTIYVVLPTEPQQPNPMRPPPPAMSPEDKRIITEAVNAAGMSIFLAGWSGPQMDYMPGAGTYDFADYLKSTWGIDVRYQYLTLAAVPNPDKPNLWVPIRPNPVVLSTKYIEFTDQPIARPLQTSVGGFDTVCPLQIVEGTDRPAGVTVEPIAVVRPSTDVWAVADVMKVQEELKTLQGMRKGDRDVAAPFPVALAAAGPQGHKAVVFGSEGFAMNGMLEAVGGFVPTGAGFQVVPAFPANADLFLNTLHWLTGDAERIAVGPKANEVPRLDKLKEGPTAVFWRVFLAGIWPALALVVGGGVFLLRRR